MNILISGFCGKMGQTVYKQAQNFSDITVVEGYDRKESIEKFGSCGVKLIDDLNNSSLCDVVIDFSHFSVVPTVLDFCVKNKKPLVLATTGIKEEDEQKIIEASKVIPIFRSSNMSEGVFVLLKLLKQATAMLNGWEIEIIEKHHNKKIDAPSGTAKMMLSEVLSEREDLNVIYGRDSSSGKRQPNDICVHSLRGGGVVGEHEISFFNENEIISINHEALSKGIFADGAIKAAKFLYGKENGLYAMKDLF